MNVSISRQIGSVFFIIGIEVGAGILALPILVANIGFPLATVIMIISWALMTYTALLVCEANLALEDGISFAGMAKKLLGTYGQTIVWISFLLLLYMIIVAYISAAGSAISSITTINEYLAILIFVILLGILVIIGITAVDWVNRILLSIKLFLLLFVCFLLLSKINLAHLTTSYINGIAVFTALPVFVTSFTSHLIIPPLRTYLHSNAKVIARVFIVGSVIPLILYLLWVIGIVGLIPFTGENSFTLIFAKGTHANIGDILNLVKANLDNKIIYAVISSFSNISVATSFLGVSLALFHFLIDGFKLNKLSVINKNIIASLLTFCIPLMIIYFFPNIFIKALGYVGLCCAVLLVIIPFFMIRKLKLQGHVFKIKYISHNIPLYTALILGLAVVIIQLFL